MAAIFYASPNFSPKFRDTRSMLDCSWPHYIEIDLSGGVTISFHTTYEQTYSGQPGLGSHTFASLQEAKNHFRYYPYVLRSLESFLPNAKYCYMRCDPVAVYKQ